VLQLNSRLRTTATVLVVATTLLAVAGCDFLVSPEQRFERAQSYVQKGEYRSALVELKNALQKQPDLYEARVLLAEVALALGDPSSAEAELNRLPESSEEHPDLRLRIDLASGRADAVLQKSASGSIAGVTPAKLSMYRAMALQALGRSAEAEQEYRSAVQAEPALLEARVGVIETMAAQGDTATALQLATELIEQHPESGIAWHAQGSLLARSGKTDEARAALLKARDLSGKQMQLSRQAALLSTLIEVQLTGHDLEGAKASVEAMNRIAGGSSLASMMAARVAMASNDYAEAASGLRRLVNAAPQLTPARHLLGVALTAQGNLEQASQELSRVVEQAPQNLEARQLLAQVRMRLHDSDGALRVLVPAIQSNADDSRLAAMFDEVRTQAGNDPGAIATLERALRETPDNANLQLQLANVYLRAGAPDKAVALLRRNQRGSDRSTPRIRAAASHCTVPGAGCSACSHRFAAGARHQPTDTEPGRGLPCTRGRLRQQPCAVERRAGQGCEAARPAGYACACRMAGAQVRCCAFGAAASDRSGSSQQLGADDDGRNGSRSGRGGGGRRAVGNYARGNPPGYRATVTARALGVAAQ